MTIIVWLLVIQIESFTSQAGGPAAFTVDNIATQQDCEALKTVMLKTLDNVTNSQCYPVAKRR